MRYFSIVCHRGHCGTGNGTEIKFAVQAKNLLEACKIARKMPSVKHTRGIIHGKEISFDEYNHLRRVGAYKKFNITNLV